MSTTPEILNPHDPEWDLIIRPKTGWLDLNLREVWKYRDLIVLFVRRDFVAQYKQTILGPLWHLIQPVMTTIVFIVVFTGIAGIPTDGAHPVVFYMCGLTIWNYFSACLTSTSNTFISNAGIFGKVYFPRLVTPLSIVLSNLVKFLIQFLLLFSVMAYFNFNGYPLHIGWAICWLPLVLVVTASFALGLGIIISALTTKYRDFGVLVTFGVQLLMYATPIVYPLSFLKEKRVLWIMELNPLAALVEAYRYILIGSGTFTPGQLIYSSVVSVLILFSGLVLFNRVEKTFMDTV